LFDNSTVESTYHSGDTAEVADVSSYEIQYLYSEGDHYVFMDTESFEQHIIPDTVVGDKKHFLKEGMVVTGLLWDNKPIDISLPNFVELKVVESTIATKTDTITAQNKTVLLETGYSIGVPAFVKEGDTLKIDTRSGTYVERISGKK